MSKFENSAALPADLMKKLIYRMRFCFSEQELRSFSRPGFLLLNSSQILPMSYRLGTLKIPQDQKINADYDAYRDLLQQFG